MPTGEDLARSINGYTNERNPLTELHRALIRTVPFAPGDIQVKGVTMAYQGEDGTAQVSDGVIVTIDTNITGAYYIADTLNELVDNAKGNRTQ